MPSVFSHAVAALGIAGCFYRPEIPRRVWLLGALCAAAPDLDVIGFRLGIPYAHPLGHRGLTHSLPFAAAVSAALVAARRHETGIRPASLWWWFLCCATASHGLLDAFTDGGLGIALFAPFSDNRYFFPFQPIEVSPIGIRSFISARGLEVLASELVWVWLPSLVVGGAALAWRRTLDRDP